MICPNCKAYVQEDYYTGGIIVYCPNCGLYLRLPYQSSPSQTTDDTIDKGKENALPYQSHFQTADDTVHG